MDECPYLKKVGAGDEIGYYCKLDGGICPREYGYECEEYRRQHEKD